MATTTTTTQVKAINDDLFNLENQIHSKYYVNFQASTNDYYNNPAKLYEKRILNQNTTIVAGSGFINSPVYTASYNGNVIFSAVSGSTTSTQFKQIQSLLRGNYSYTSSWIPISSSTSINMVCNSFTAISFTSNLFGDKLTYNSTQLGNFSFTWGGTTYNVLPYEDVSERYTINLKNIYYNSPQSALGFIYTGTTLTANSFKGLVFGELGLIFFYTGSGTLTPINNAQFTAVNLTCKQQLNSRTYFCRITNEKFNASNNNTWYTWSNDLGTNIRRQGIDFTVITSIGLYNDDDTLLAIAKLSEPIIKYRDTELHVKVVLQY